MEGIPRSTRWLIYGACASICYPLINNCLFPNYTRVQKAEKRTVIVTGATGNLGKAICYNLAKRKARIIMACRDMDKCKVARREIVLASQHKGIACRHLDLEDIDSINKFAQQMEETEPHIDILINNAAVKNLEKKEMTKYGIEKHFFVNFVAPFLLTFRLMDQLKKSAEITRDSRIVNVIGNPIKSWDVNLNDINFDTRKYKPKAAYNQSKLALAYFTILLDKFNREQKNQVFVYGTNPSVSSIRRTFDHPIGLLEGINSFLDTYFKHSPYRVSSTAVRCALEDDWNNAKHSGKLYGYLHQSWGWGVAANDENKAKLVWNYAANSLLKIPDKVEGKNLESRVGDIENPNKNKPISATDKKESSDTQAKYENNK